MLLLKMQKENMCPLGQEKIFNFPIVDKLFGLFFSVPKFVLANFESFSSHTCCIKLEKKIKNLLFQEKGSIF